ncbi:MAG: HAD hydrolase family protein [Lachnospiraceae bacterium]
MFQQAGESYAVANAADGVKKAAKYVAPSYEEMAFWNFKTCRKGIQKRTDQNKPRPFTEM